MGNYKPFTSKATIYEVFSGKKKLYQTTSLSMAKMYANNKASKSKRKNTMYSIKKVSLVGYYK